MTPRLSSQSPVSFLFLLSLYSWQEEVTFKPRSSWTSFQHRYLAGSAMHYLRLYERFIKGSLRDRVLNHSNGTLRGIWSHGYIWKPCRRTQGIMIYFICLNKLHKHCSATAPFTSRNSQRAAPLHVCTWTKHISKLIFTFAKFHET